MLFNSIEFLIFLPIVFMLYWFVFKRLQFQNLFIVCVSYLFYGWWDWRFLILIAITTFFSFYSGILIEKQERSRKRQMLISTINITFNLLILATFKYFNFFSENFNALFRSLGIQLDNFTLDVLLPVGISFYTFQALSYTIDVYQKRLTATHNIIAFFAYISFFPQLVAGPIERATNLLPQFLKVRTFNHAKAVDGMRQILWGFFKKMIVADNCALAANEIFNNYTGHSGSTLILGAIFFTFQIYGDFSGYSDIAIGTARLFGINLMRNFNFPYFSRDIAEFWRKWHISLTTWFRDYIYIPLGGSRSGKWKAFRNTVIIFLVSGFWHGANWTFITWGAYHALLFLPLLLLGQNRKFVGVIAQGRLLPGIKEIVQMLLTFMLVVFGWIIFRAETINKAWDYIYRIFSESFFPLPAKGATCLLFIAILLIIEWFQREKEHGLQFLSQRPAGVRWSFYIFICTIIMLFYGEFTNFIYFQF